MVISISDTTIIIICLCIGCCYLMRGLIEIIKHIND